MHRPPIRRRGEIRSLDVARELFSWANAMFAINVICGAVKILHCQMPLLFAILALLIQEHV